MARTVCINTPADSVERLSIALFATCIVAISFSAGCRAPWQGKPLVKNESASLAWLDSSGKSDDATASDLSPQPPRAKRRPGSPEMTALRSEGKLPRSQLRPSEAEVPPAALATSPRQRRVGDLEQDLAVNADAAQAENAKLGSAENSSPTDMRPARTAKSDEIALVSHSKSAELDAARHAQATAKEMKRAEVERDSSSASSDKGGAITMHIGDLDDASGSGPLPNSRNTLEQQVTEDKNATSSTEIMPSAQSTIVEATNPVKQHLESPTGESPTQSMTAQGEVQSAVAELEAGELEAARAATQAAATQAAAVSPAAAPTEALQHHRIAIRDLANLAELKVLSLAFCTAVDGFGMIDKFPDYAFRADQKVLLYCELENFVSVQVDEGYETKLSGHYEIVDASGKRLEYYSLPPDKDICSNRRSDFYIAYLMQMPQKIPPGDYQLRLFIEDVHGEKTGKSEIDFRIKP